MFRNSITTRLMVSVGAIIIAMAIINMMWSVVQYKRQAEAEMKEKAAVIAQQLMATRAFIADKQDIINSDTSGEFEFKHMNPAAVGKGMGHIFAQYTGYKLKQTRLKPRAQENTPDDYEAAQLTAMAADTGIAEAWDFDTLDEENVFRYMLPLYYKEECMQCHGGPAGEIDISGYPKEGALPGEFAGAISVVFSTDSFERNLEQNIILQLFYAFVVLTLSLYGIYLVMGKIVITPIKDLTQKAKELGKGDWYAQIDTKSSVDEMRTLGIAFNMMAQSMQESYISLEDKVQERTQMLHLANEKLKNQSEELISMNARLSEADRLKSEFLAVMSHELRTPLTAIIAFSEMLLTVDEHLTELQREYLNDILESAHMLYNQINDILDMSKIEAGLMKPNYEIFHMSAIFDTLKYSLGPLFVKNDVEFLVHIDHNTPDISADFDKVKHIIQNLLSNAVKFTPKGGHISAWVKPVTENDLACISVTVTDDGVGIKPEDLPHIFSRYWDKKVDSEYQGTGLGLAIVKNLVELHGGTINVESKWRQGSSFSFVLPCGPGGEARGENYEFN